MQPVWQRGIHYLDLDPRTHGENDGEPRIYESGKAKVQDIKVAIVRTWHVEDWVTALNQMGALRELNTGTEHLISK